MRSALAIVALSMLALSYLAPIAVGAACLPGKYAGTGGKEGDQPFPVLVTISCEGEAVRGHIESPFGQIPISGGDAGAEQWRIEAVADGVPVTAEARRQGEDWTGTYQLGDEHGILTLRRDDAAVFAQLNAEVPENLDLTTEQWREDVAFIAEQVPARHANAFHTISEAKWRSAVAELDARLPSLSDEEIPVAFRELVARIGDAHTSVRMPASTGRLPIALFWFGDELRITATSQEYATLLGARVLRIGDVPIREAAQRAGRCVAEDNRWAVLASTPYLLRRRDALVYYGLAGAGANARLQLRLASGRTTVVDLPFDAGADMNTPAYVGGQAPIWAQNPGESLWTRELPGSIFYVNFRAYDDLRTRTLALMTEVDRLQPAKLVLDLRDNGGGDFTLFRESMLAAILERPWLNRRDRLYVLIGRETFSAAMTNAADLRLRTNATLVGEPIGERPNSYQEVRSFNTPNAHLRVGVSIKFYEALPGTGDPEAVTPHVSHPPTWARFARGDDDALEWVRRQ